MADSTKKYEEFLETLNDFYSMSPDEMLMKFNPTYFKNNELMDYITKNTNFKKRIGADSSQGQIFTFKNDPNMVVKETKICPGKTRKLFINNQCSRAKSTMDMIYRIPNTFEGKEMLYLPNYYSESLVSLILASPILTDYTPCLPRTYAIQYNAKDIDDKDTRPLYTIMEKLIPESKLDAQDVFSIMYYFFQIFHTLDVLQSIYKFTHYDLHMNNIVTRKRENNISAYAVGDGTYIYTSLPYDNVIIDFGFSRLETDGYILKPSTIYSRLAIDRPDIVDRYDFNPYYDAYGIIRIVYNSILTVKFSPQVENFMYYLLSNYFGKYNFGMEFIMRDLSPNIPSEWRPNPEYLSSYDKAKGIYPLMTPGQLKHVIAKYIVKTFQNNSTSFSDNEDFRNKLSKHNMFVSRGLINSGYLRTNNFNVYSTPGKSISLDTSYPANTIREDDREENIFAVKTKKEGDIVFHIAAISPEKPYDRGYKFCFDCCNIDIRNYMRSSKIKSGIAINGSFFKIKDNFTPIGEYKNKSILAGSDEPEKYNQDYGIITIDHEGKIDIKEKTSFINGVDYNAYDSVMQVGPMMIYDGVKRKFGSLGNDRFSCRKPEPNEDVSGEKLEDGMYNCNKIEPGELKHVKSPNPRSALFITKNNAIGILYVEGRGKRGPGVTIDEMTEICANYGAYKAINLDGGLSSQLIWKKKNENIICSTNPLHEWSYPVGNVISLVKM